MKPADKQAYLEEYELLKKKGKPFFPYAVLKDSTMALLVVGVIILMSIVLGAEQGPKADPTTTTYVPRPEWYFFFLFELLRVIKPPELVPVATIGIPTICMILLLLLPFYDRGPERNPIRRPIATTAGCLTITAYLSNDPVTRLLTSVIAFTRCRFSPLPAFIAIVLFAITKLCTVESFRKIPASETS